ncbi:uncharacterized protein LOC129565363 [Sitodiplosis mosellana]|uniref:uncharacterized protein LOC129565363 n=1 Tax=Sitodiplosis mosellana TaxID=263140 RepID=UPI0024446058|nr:uncharacterized protein LOC129565363 [Sitodiplosis mosellana]
MKFLAVLVVCLCASGGCLSADERYTSFKQQMQDILKKRLILDDENLMDLKSLNKSLINTKDPKYGITRLHSSSAAGFPISVMYLLKNGADKTIKDNVGKIPLDYAQEFDNKLVVKILIVYNMSTTIKAVPVQTCFFIAIIYGLKRMMTMLQDV